MLKKVLAALLLLLTPLTIAAEFIETHDVNEIAEAIDNGTWVLLDIDETLLETSRMLGSPPWKRFLLKRLDELEIKDKLKEYVYSQITYLVMRKLPFYSVDERFPALIHKLQKQRIPVQGLTGRGRNIWSRIEKRGVDNVTRDQLLTVGIDFTKSVQPAHFNSHSHYSHGIIFTANAAKGPFLLEFMKKHDYRPKKVVFVDDKFSEVESVVKTLEGKGIKCKGFHYTYAAAKAQPFDSAIAHRQLFFVEHDLAPTDDEAKADLANGLQKDSLIALLDAYIYLFALEAIQLPSGEFQSLRAVILAE